MKIILMGPQGCGKGTQADMIAEQYELKHISSGDILRENIRENTQLGRVAQKYINEGKLLPDNHLITMIIDRIHKPDCKKGYVLDGFPRTLNQAEELLKNEKIDVVIDIKIPDDESVKRLSSRLNCPNGHVFNKSSNPPKKEGICDACGAKLFIREDDKPAAIKVRLKSYHEITDPALRFFNEKGLLRKVDGTKNIDEVFNEIEKIIWVKNKK